MHYHLEVIIPPDADPTTAVAQALAPFDENAAKEGRVGPAFWDFWVIGGRWAGLKQEASLDQEKLSEFRQWLQDEKVMVKGFQCGKHELADAGTVDKVDAKWREMFPGSGPHCTLFKHSNDQYDSNAALSQDVCRLEDCPDITPERVIIAAANYKEDGLAAVHMKQTEFWNGLSHEETAWDGSVQSAVSEWNEKLSTYKPEYAKTRRVTGSWLVVTVDYHS